MIWFTADTHAWHEKIIEHGHRPFNNAEEMTEKLAKNINSYVQPNDILYHLGDFAWLNSTKAEEFRDMINCKKIHLIAGNHDQKIIKDKKKYHMFEKMYGNTYLDLKFNKQKVTLCHYPMESWNCSTHESWHLHGHSHGFLTHIINNRIDVGVDCHNYKPINLDIIETIINVRNKTT